MDTKNLSLPKLNQFNPTLESTALKLMEEAGELAQVIGKFRGLSGEQISMDEETIVREVANELLDVAQTAVTMMFVIPAIGLEPIQSCLHQILSLTCLPISPRRRMRESCYQRWLEKATEQNDNCFFTLFALE